MLGFPALIQNILGAGDAFVAAFIYGLVKGCACVRAVRLVNAFGAIVVTGRGCSNLMPTLGEVEAMTAPYAGLESEDI